MFQRTLLALSFAPMLSAQQPALSFVPGAEASAPAAAPVAGAARAGRGFGAAVRVNARAGLQLVDGELRGCADGYRVRFDDDGFEFTPAFGHRAESSHPQAFRLEAIGRGGELAPPPAAVRHHAELRVDYERGQVTERYDVGPAGVEQSFVFHDRPAGRGNLVVRSRLRTDLQVTPDDVGLRLELPGVGAFRIGGVTGVDAHGRRVAGTMRWQDGWLEYELPAAFVDGAALPFTLDPLIGAAFGVSLNSPLADTTPSVAYDVSSDRYLVVWATTISATDHDINGQFVSRAGLLTGNRIPIDVTTADTKAPAVANFNARNAFVVAFDRGDDVYGRIVTAATGALSSEAPIATGTGTQHAPTIGGDAVPSVVNVPDHGICVWEDTTAHALRAIQVVVNTDQTLSVAGSASTLAQGGTAYQPRISRSGGTIQHYAIVFFQSTTNEIQSLLVSSAGTVLTLPTRVAGSAIHAIGHPDVDGDGRNWVVTWQSQNANSFGIVAATLAATSVPVALVPGPQQIVEEDNDGMDETVPTVFWTGGSAVVAFADQVNRTGVRDNDVVVRSLDPFLCVPCESGPFPAGIGGSIFPACCSTLSGGGVADEGLVVWQAVPGDILARLWHSVDGTVTSLGGSCGAGGIAQATCVRVPNASFTHRLQGTTPLAPVFLIQAVTQTNATCGPCTVVPTLNGAVTQFFLADTLGNVAAPSRIPDNAALRGVTQFDQWLTFRVGGNGACSQFTYDLSNALRLVIE